MAQTIKLKRSAQSGVSGIPSTLNLELGEVGINTYHGKMYIKKDDGTESIVEVGDTSGYLPLSGGTLTGNLSLGDNVKLQLGNQTNGDLQIYHTGSYSAITDVGSGSLFIGGSTFVDIGNASLSETSARFYPDGAVTLYHDNSIKLATTSTGIDVTGSVVADLLTTDDDVSGLTTLGRYSSGFAYSLLRPSASATGLEIRTNAGNALAHFLNDGTTKLHHNGSPKISTTSTGISISNDANFPDNGKAIFGADDDFKIYHTATGNHSIIEETGGGNLVVRTNGSQIEFDKGSTEYMARMIPDGAVELYYDSALKLATTSTGIDVTGTATMDGLTVVGTGSISGDTTSHAGSVYNANTSGAVLKLRSGSVGGTASVLGVFDGNNNEKARFTASGRLGLGVTNPSGTLDIGGQHILSDNYDAVGAVFRRNGTYGSVISLGRQGVSDGVTLDYPADNTFSVSTANTERLKVNVSGIHVTGSVTADGAEIDVTRSNTAGSGFLALDLVGTNGDFAHRVDTSNAYYLDYYTGSAWRPTIKIEGQTGDISFYDSSGNQGLFWDSSASYLGLGTTTVNADLHISKTSGAKLWITAQGNNPSDAGSLRFAELNNGNNYFEFKHDGSSNTLSLNSTNGNLVTFNRSNKSTSFSGSVTATVASADPKLKAAYNSSNYIGISHEKINVQGGGVGLIIQGNGVDRATFASGGGLTLANGDLTLTSGSVTSTTGFTTGANTRVQASSGMLFLNGPSALAFEVGAGSEKMRLTSTGLGIGTSSPSEKLSILGGHISVGDSSGVTGTEFLLEGYREIYNGSKYGNISIRSTYNPASNASDMLFYTASSGTNTAEALKISSSANVNIPNGSLMVGSTTAPSYPLEVQSGGVGTVLRAGTSFVSIDSVGSASSPSLILNGDDNTGIWHPASDTLAVSTGGSERMRIDNQGQVKIHTPITNGFFGLSLQYNNTDTADFKVNQATGQIKIGGSATGYYPTFWSNNTERTRIASNGTLYHGKTADSLNTGGLQTLISGQTSITQSYNEPLRLNRMSSQGAIQKFYYNGGEVGSIGSYGGHPYIGGDNAGNATFLRFWTGSTPSVRPSTNSGTNADNTLDLGSSAARFKDLYLSNNATAQKLTLTKAPVGLFTIEVDGTNTGQPNLIVKKSTSEALRVDNNNNLLVGKTVQGLTNAGFEVAQTGQASATQSGASCLRLNRLSSDGQILQFRKDGTTVGSIGSLSGTQLLIDSGGDRSGIRLEDNALLPRKNSAMANGTVSLGSATYRFKDLYLSNKVYANYIGSSGDTNTNIYFPTGDQIRFITGGNERARIDASGNLLVGTTVANPAGANSVGVGISSGSYGGFIGVTRDGNTPVEINRKTSDGNLITFRKDSSSVGSIGTEGGDLTIGAGTNCGLQFNDGNAAIRPFNIAGNSPVDNAVSLGISTTRFKDLYLSGKIYGSTLGIGDAGIQADQYSNAVKPFRPDITSGTSDNYLDLGTSSVRWVDIYATNGTIQTSDRNEKQDIESLSEAEERVAIAAKGLLKKFRWKSAVEDKGDDARIHFGIIAQDLQDAFEAEGLDAGRYGMFISTTWTDEDGEEQTRMGVRYSELLAFIISAI